LIGPVRRLGADHRVTVSSRPGRRHPQNHPHSQSLGRGFDPHQPYAVAYSPWAEPLERVGWRLGSAQERTEAGPPAARALVKRPSLQISARDLRIPCSSLSELPADEVSPREGE
jgi:hypothetical protein